MSVLKTILIAGIALFGATITQAAGLENMTDAEREVFRAEVREYLLDNPEVILEAIEVLEQRQAQSEAQSDLELVRENFDELTRDGYSWVGGNPDGPITIVEFSDYRCTFCKRAHPEVAALLAANDDVRFVMKEFPILGADSTLSSKAAISVLTKQGNDVYEAFHNLLMSHNGAVNVKTLSRLVVKAGGDADLMVAHMDDPLIEQIIAKNRALAVRMKISGTPSFVIGTEMLRGFAPAATMQGFVDRARAQL
ncbi:hypothetical protein A9Q96_03630 [Rhodobacterales bacterium 52_120_T64]|mgnify:CR=1 FL=1|nr:hypothetical protein A9Q96_03630 [Rhodobacterales bacterium 52_120_T64]